MIPDVADRIHMLPRMSKEDFASLVNASDVMLDPIHVGVGTTMYEGLATGTPLVTWPGQFAHARITYANYRKMGVMDCVASSPEEYVEIALNLGNDRSLRESVKEKILASNQVIYDDMEYVREMEEFFLEAIEEARSQ